MSIHPLWWAAWFLMFVVLETIALVNENPNDTLTQTIVTYVPPWAVFAGIGWFLWHMVISFLDRRAGKKGR